MKEEGKDDRVTSIKTEREENLVMKKRRKKKGEERRLNNNLEKQCVRLPSPSVFIGKRTVERRSLAVLLLARNDVFRVRKKVIRGANTVFFYMRYSGTVENF